MYRAVRKEQMKIMREIFDSLGEASRTRAVFERQTFVHKYIALPGTISEKAKEALKLWFIGEFYHVHLKSLSPDGYNHIMDLGSGAYGVVSMVESEDNG